MTRRQNPNSLQQHLTRRREEAKTLHKKQVLTCIEQKTKVQLQLFTELQLVSNKKRHKKDKKTEKKVKGTSWIRVVMRLWRTRPTVMQLSQGNRTMLNQTRETASQD